MKKPLEQTKILIVAPCQDDGLPLPATLEKLGYKAAELAASAGEAQAAVLRLTPDLILVDLPAVNGREIISAMEQIKALHSVAVVYLAGSPEEEEYKLARLAGPLGCVLKPFQDRDLFLAMEMALYHHRMEQRLKVGEERYRLLLMRCPLALPCTRSWRMKPARLAITAFWR